MDITDAMTIDEKFTDLILDIEENNVDKTKQDNFNGMKIVIRNKQQSSGKSEIKNQENLVM